MTDLHSRLQAIAGPVAPPTSTMVDADLARGRRALRRRRTATLVTGSAVAAAAVLTAVLTLPAVLLDRSGGDPGGTSTGTGAVTQLVAYTGEQPSGFTLDRVPAGWQIQGQDEWTLTLARPDAADQDVRSCVGKICIWLQEFVPTGVVSRQVEVAGRPGILATMHDTTHPGTLFVEVRPDVYLTIQFWDGLNWSETEIVEFGAGIHVHDDARVTHG
ncbi:hypothetical protein O7623_14690 [Solwaraspora sp. WMMD791]|uniref:hypothetical protein n=1 Tax=Solwaraspora sp. WMMD791 TaxID=3016086 RepID=UPI00249C0D3E|nr:hypothetical protein [Solwaraspora sp. WMMD791]WFE30352.1 hypothetical protein O7623_14690 [Solwaraspora sp. WMMD791]